MNCITKLIAVGFSALAFAGAVKAQSLHIVVDKGNGHLYEVKSNLHLNGAYQQNPHCVGSVLVDGYTDRASRGQSLGAVIVGGGLAQTLTIEAQDETICLKRSIALSNGYVNRIALDPRWRDMSVFCHLNGKLLSVHIPIGSR